MCVCVISRYCKTRKSVCVISNSSRVFHVVPIPRPLCLRANEVHQVLVKKSQQLHINRCSRPLYLGTSIFCLRNTVVKTADLFALLQKQYFTSKWTFCLGTSAFIAILVLHIPGLSGRMVGFKGPLNIITTLSLTPSCCSRNFQDWPRHQASTMSWILRKLQPRFWSIYICSSLEGLDHQQHRKPFETACGYLVFVSDSRIIVEPVLLGTNCPPGPSTPRTKRLKSAL